MDCSDWQKPAADDVWRAIDIYVACAYHGQPPPSAVRARLDSLRAAREDFYDISAFEQDAHRPPQKLLLRLGNRFYPHMKLVIERSPDEVHSLFRADTHDRHVRPAANSKEHELFAKLMEDNQRLAEQIEAAWEEAKLPTFKQYLRDDLARRMKTRKGWPGSSGI